MSIIFIIVCFEKTFYVYYIMLLKNILNTMSIILIIVCFEKNILNTMSIIFSILYF